MASAWARMWAGVILSSSPVYSFGGFGLRVMMMLLVTL